MPKAALLEFADAKLKTAAAASGKVPHLAAGWVDNLDWLANYFAIKVTSKWSDALECTSVAPVPLFVGDVALAKAVVEYTQKNTGSHLRDLSAAGENLRLLDAFGAFPATRLIAFAHAMDSRRGGKKGRATRAVGDTDWRNGNEQSTVLVRDSERGQRRAEASTWYERAGELGDRVAHDLSARNYSALETHRTQTMFGRPRTLYELPTTEKARGLADCAPDYLANGARTIQTVRIVFAGAEKESEEVSELSRVGATQRPHEARSGDRNVRTECEAGDDDAGEAGRLSGAGAT